LIAREPCSRPSPHIAEKAEQISLLCRKEVMRMPVYNIFPRYRIEAATPTQATKKLLDAVEANKDEDFHISDSVRKSDDEADNDKPAGVGTILKRQITGK